MPLLFAVTLCLGAALVFSVQPMLAKGLLPLLGGSPAVWTVCMAFFQATVLAGYLYAHAIARLAIGLQAAIHAVVLVLPLAFLPVALGAGSTPPPAPGSSALRWLVATLIGTAGIPVFVVATTAPLLQRWFAATGHRDGDDPYFLYGASNLGSLLALLAYPLAIEPRLPLARQGELWAAGYLALAALSLACAAAARRSPRRDPVVHEPGTRREPLAWWRWVWLAFLPSSLMLGVTAYLSTDIAPVPLLWVIPLGLYLLSFILTFARRPIVPRSWAARALPLGAMALALILGAGLVQSWLVPVHLLTFFAAAMVCHGELALRRPPARDLTAFYLAVALGGALGGVFNGVLAPVVFDRLAEYPLAVVLACTVLSGPTPARLRDAAVPAAILVLAAASVTNHHGWTDTAPGMAGSALASGLVVLVCWTHRVRPLRFALGIGAVLLATGLSAGVNGRVVHQERNLFGVLQVTEDPVGRGRRLFQGRTLHGQQSLDPGLRREPLSYYHRSGPIGQVFDEWQGRRARASGAVAVAVVGLGAGTLACYARPEERWTFYEIDPAVVRIAADPRMFTFLSDSRAGAIEVVTGDARLRLHEASPGAFGLIVLDAFSSDAIPVHLLTREALRVYLGRLSSGGLLALHISNRYVDLDPVVGTLARDAGLVRRIRRDLALAPAEARAGKQKSTWAVMAARERDLGRLASDPRWVAPRPDAGRPWTDDFSDLARHLILRPR